MTFGSGEIDPSQPLGGAGTPVRTATPAQNQVTFSRRELNRILDLYGRKVAAGEWRDYAIDFLKDRAVFSVFRRDIGSADLPHRKKSETGTPARRVQRDFRERSCRSPRPRTRSRVALD